MSEIPVSHIDDSHKLIADASIDLYELTPADGSGTIYFKNDSAIVWRGRTYEGIPLGVSGEKKTSDTGITMPKMTIGNGAVDLSPFKPLIYDGGLDNAIVFRRRMLLDNVLNNRLIFEPMTYRIKRVEEYSRMRITVQLATTSDSLGFQMPYREYLPPAFPSVQM